MARALYLGVGPYFAIFFAKFHPYFRERNFREISTLFWGFGEISAKFSKFRELGTKFRQNTAKFGAKCAYVAPWQTIFGKISPNLPKKGKISDKNNEINFGPFSAK